MSARFRVLHLVGPFQAILPEVESAERSIPFTESLVDIATSPFYALFYVVFMLSACALFSITWIQASASSARMWLSNSSHMGEAAHFEKSKLKELNRYITTTTAFGAMCIAALTVVADFIEAIGNHSSVLQDLRDGESN